MANRYGEAAILAARHGAGMGPVASWENAMEKLYPTSPSARNKGGPRAAFLGLCEEGMVKDIPAGHYSTAKENKACAVLAAQLLMKGEQRYSLSSLWAAVKLDPKREHNAQMDVVLALWKNGLIQPRG